MRLRDATMIGALLLTGLCAPGRPGYADGPKRPNVVLIIADDMAWDDCGAFGNPKVRTPNLDKLAREGMRFDRAFVTASSCSPSRSSLITGRYPHNTDAEELHWPLPPSQVTFVEKLKGSGYWTAAAGKWHLGNAVKSRFDVVREANPAGFQLAAGKSAKARMTAEGSGAGGAAGGRGAPTGGGCRWARGPRTPPGARPFLVGLPPGDRPGDYRGGGPAGPRGRGVVIAPPPPPDLPAGQNTLPRY